MTRNVKGEKELFVTTQRIIEYYEESEKEIICQQR
jgi:hypothetical protein